MYKLRDKIHVALIEDHTIVRDGIRKVLEQEEDIQVVGEASSGEQGYQLAISEQPNVVIMDLSLPGMSGLETTRKIISRLSNVNVLVLTMHENALQAERAIQAGAKGYMTKSSDMDSVVEAIRAVASGKVFLDQKIASELAILKMSGGGSPLSSLSPREFEIFKLVSSGMRTDEVADTLSLTSKTVSNYVSQIKNKLSINTTAEMVHLALEHGILPDSVNSSQLP